MARQITCDMCKNEPAAAMYSTLHDGTTLAVGDDCSFSFAYGLAVAAGVLPDPAAEPEPSFVATEDAAEVPTDESAPGAPKAAKTRRKAPSEA